MFHWIFFRSDEVFSKNDDTNDEDDEKKTKMRNYNTIRRMI